MGEYFEEKKGILQIIFAVVIVAITFATIRYGFYVDENGLLTIYKGIYQGQRMFVDSWESLQTGGILAHPLLALYYQLLQPLFSELSINVGLVLYMRYCYLFVRLIVAVYVYLTLRNSNFENGAFPAAAFYFMFILDWKDFSYKSYCDLAVMLTLCFMVRFIYNRKTVYAVLTGLTVCVAVLAYPTMIILAVCLGVFWLIMAISDEAPRSAVIGYVLACFVIGILVALYLEYTSGWGNIIAQLPNLGDQDYDDPFYIRLGKMLISYVAFAVIAYFPIVVIRIWDKLRGVSEEAERAILTIYFLLFVVGIMVLRIDSISNSRFVYGCLLVFFWFPYFMREKEDRTYTKIGCYRNNGSEERQILWCIFIVSVITQLIWSVSTNQGIAVPGLMCVYVVMATILLFAKDDVEYRGMIALLIILSVFFNNVWVADNNGGFASVFEPMYYAESGELKGVALPEDEYNTNEAVMRLLENVSSEDKLLVAFGANSAGYLNSEAWQGTYSVYARTQLNRKIIDYYELNPENMADYMLLDKSHPKYELFVDNEAGQYLLNLYTNEIASEGDIVLLGR